jgi:hypothetical protein
MAIVYVGGFAGNRPGSTSTATITFALTGGTDSTPQADDLVIISVAVGSVGRTPACAVSGYTALGQLNSNGTTSDTSHNVSYTFMPGTPDTTFTLPSTGNGADGQAYTVQVFRNVDATTPMDATSTTATGTGTARPDPPSITPVTAGAWVVICGAGASPLGANYTGPANFTTNFVTSVGADTSDAMVGSGYWTGWSSGAVNPAAFTGGTTGAAESWTARTMALRPYVDTTAPTLSGQTVASVTATGGTPKVTTDEATGTAYMVVVPNGDTPSVAQIKAGQRSNGTAALANQNQAVSGTGVQTFSAVTGLTSNTPYDVWFVHRDAAGNDSSSVKADVSTLTAFNDIRQDIINGFDSAQAEAAGWDVKKATIPLSAVVRTSDTVVTITLPAIASYAITVAETITATVPGSALVGGSPVVATPTISITDSGAAAITGDLSQTLGAVTLSSTGTVDIQGTTSATLDVVTLASTGTVEVQGVSSATLGAVTLASTGTVDVQGVSAVTLDAVTLASTGTVEVQGVAAQTLDAVTLSSDGVIGNAPITGDLAQTLDAVTLSSTGTVDVVGQLAQTLDAVALSSTGTVDVAGVSATTLAAVTVTATGTVEIQGTADVTLAAVTSTATGTVDIAGAADFVLGAVTTTATGTVDIVGQATVTLDAVTLQADGLVGAAPVEGVLTATLAEVTLTADGSLGAAPVDGVLTQTLGDVTLSADGSISISGVLGAVLGDVVVTATGTVITPTESPWQPVMTIGSSAHGYGSTINTSVTYAE